MYYELLVTKTEFHTAKNETSKVPVLKKVFIYYYSSFRALVGRPATARAVGCHSPPPLDSSK